MKKILVTGGIGYIGSHTVVELYKAGYEAIVIDNLSNSKKSVLKRIEQITGTEIKFYENDVRDAAALDKIFTENKIEAVIHFAGLKAVGESVEKPLEYYNNNIIGTLTLLEAMKRNNCKNIVFSSSATVYGNPHTVPIEEHFPLSATNPYGRSKLIIEEMLQDIYKADATMNIAILRYFNPIGALDNGLIGEDPNGIPNNLCPYITKVAVGKLSHLNVFGNDYPTIDGTGVRDYIHVVDLARGHTLALNKLFTESGLFIVNLGTGRGYSVLEVVNEFSKILGKEIPYKIVDRRAGDIATCYADCKFAEKLLNFKTEKTLTEMCRDALNFQLKNPNGYEDD